MKLIVTTTINIAASPNEIWKILTDFENYSSWNPFINSIEGTVQPGNKIIVAIEGMIFKPVVLRFDKEKELRWIGVLASKHLFAGEHTFKIIKQADGTCNFEHFENFSGLLLPFFQKKLKRETKAGFTAMNIKLKQKAESLN